MTKAQTLELLQKQIPGFYSAEQVIKMISEIEDSQSKPATLTAMQRIGFTESLLKEIEDQIDGMGIDVVDEYSAGFKLHGNEITLADIDTNVAGIMEKVEKAIHDQVSSFFEVNDEDFITEN